MRTSDIRRVIDASLSGLKLSSLERDALLSRAVDEKAPAPPRRHPAKYLILAAIVAILTLAIVVPAVGGQSHRAKVESCEDSVRLSIEREPDAPDSFPETGFSDAVVAAWGGELCDLLSELGAQVLLPSRMPEGYRFVSLNADLLEIGKLDAWYENDAGETLLLRITVMRGYQTWTSFVESEPETTELWPLGGVEYTYARNHESASVSWTEGNCAVSISAPLSHEAMRKMIESIYE